MAPSFFVAPSGNDVWFEADLPQVSETVLHRSAAQFRNARHPLVPLLATLPAFALRHAGLSERSVLALLSATAAAGWILIFYALVRAMTRRRTDAAVFTALACSTAHAIFWLPATETYTAGSISLLIPVVLFALDVEHRCRERSYVLASIASLSVTTTNWMSGIVAAAARWPWRRALQITANAFAAVVVLWCVQRMIFPDAPFFFGYSHERRFMFSEAAGGAGPILRALYFHSIVMPSIQVVTEPKWGAAMSVQRAAIGSTGWWGLAATLLWAALLVLTAAELLMRRDDRRLRAVLVSLVAAQTVLHLVYGEETFLYTMHIGPLLVAAVALAATGTRRRVMLAIALALTLCAAVNNVEQLAVARSFFLHIPHGT
jgi:hypothetical protein